MVDRPQGAAPKSYKILYLQFEATNLPSDLRINDIPLAGGRTGIRRSQGIALHEYVVPGVNHVTLDWGGGPESVTETGTEPVAANAAVRARIALFSDGDPLENANGRTLTVLEPALVPGQIGPQRIEARFEVFEPGFLPPTWSWTRAQPLASVFSGPQMQVFFTRLIHLFEAADVDGLLDLWRTKMIEAAQAYPAVPYDAIVAAQRQDFSALQQIPAEERRLDPARLVLRLAAGGRLMELRDADGGPFLRSHNAPPAARHGAAGIAVFACLIGQTPEGPIGVIR